MNNEMNLWGDILLPPRQILKQQAEILEKLTNNIIKTEIKCADYGEYQLLISHSNAIFNDNILIATIYKANNYPFIIQQGHYGKQIEIKDQQEYIEQLRLILSSNDTRDVITNILNYEY